MTKGEVINSITIFLAPILGPFTKRDRCVLFHGTLNFSSFMSVVLHNNHIPQQIQSITKYDKLGNRQCIADPSFVGINDLPAQLHQ